MRLYTVLYKTAWGKDAVKKIEAKRLQHLYSKFDRIKPNATIQKIYVNHTNTIHEEVYNG
jgi:hypothetical protein|tara:strand:+ start:136 stop:315 length:180 start_codon:yes stop_codon:yes gene_type:complete